MDFILWPKIFSSYRISYVNFAFGPIVCRTQSLQREIMMDIGGRGTFLSTGETRHKRFSLIDLSHSSRSIIAY